MACITWFFNLLDRIGVEYAMRKSFHKVGLCFANANKLTISPFAVAWIACFSVLFEKNEIDCAKHKGLEKIRGSNLRLCFVIANKFTESRLAMA